MVSTRRTAWVLQPLESEVKSSCHERVTLVPHELYARITRTTRGSTVGMNVGVSVGSAVGGRVGLGVGASVGSSVGFLRAPQGML